MYMGPKARTIISRISASSLALLPLASFAAAGELQNPLRFDSLTEFLAAILHLVVLIMFPLIILFIVFIGFKFIAAQGNADKIKEARKLFFWAIVGALIILGAQVLASAIQGTISQLSA